MCFCGDAVVTLFPARRISVFYRKRPPKLRGLRRKPLTRKLTPLSVVAAKILSLGKFALEVVNFRPARLRRRRP